MAAGEYTPKNPEVELRVLKELYNQTAYIYKQYNGGVLAAEHGKGTRTDRYDIHNPDVPGNIIKDKAWIEHQIFDDGIRHDILRLCRSTIYSDDGVKSFLTTVYSMDAREYLHLTRVQTIPHIRRYIYLQAMGRDDEVVTDTSGYLVPASLKDDRQVVLPLPKTLEEGLIGLDDVTNINEILEAINKAQSRPRRAHKRGGVVVDFIDRNL